MSNNEWTLAELQPQIEVTRQRIQQFRLSLGRFFVAKQPLIDVMVVAAVAQEPLLLVGPPGTAKSDLVLKFKDALDIPEEDYFEYMLTRFTEPSEIIGPIDINLLREGRYVRREQGKLPTARVAFLDEIFKSNSAILNLLLTIINERKFYQDGVPQPVRLQLLLAAANEIPEQGELSALKDRFVLKVPCESVLEEHFSELVDVGLQSDVYRTLGQQPWKGGLCSLLDLQRAHRYLTLLFSQQEERPDGTTVTDRHRFFPQDVFQEFQRLVKTLRREDRIFISDRKLVKLYKLLRTRAWLLRGGTVSRDDLKLLAFVGDTHDELLRLQEKIPFLLQ